MTTLATRYIKLAKKLVPEHPELWSIEDYIDCPNTIGEKMFGKSEYLGGMAVVLLNLIEKGLDI